MSVAENLKRHLASIGLGFDILTPTANNVISLRRQVFMLQQSRLVKTG